MPFILDCKTVIFLRWSVNECVQSSKKMSGVSVFAWLWGTYTLRMRIYAFGTSHLSIDLREKREKRRLFCSQFLKI